MEFWTLQVLPLLGLLLVFGILAYFLYRTYLKSAIPRGPTANQAQGFAPESCYLEIDGARLHYVQAGQGRDLVLLHGIGASIFIWRFLFPLLQTRYRVTALDLPGFGRSAKDSRRSYGLDAQAQFVIQTLDHLRIKNPVLVGSSMGGAISLWMARLAPERFKDLIALAPATDSKLVPVPIHAFAEAAPFLRPAINRKTMKTILKRVLARRELVTDEVVDAYLEPFLDDGNALRAFWSATALLGDRRLPSELRHVHARTLVIYGERDLIVPRKSIDRMLKFLPNASLLLHKDGGHHIMEDEPDWIFSAIDSFISASPKANKF